jgi:hypothetical protein
LRAQREEQGPAEDLDCEDERPTVVVLNEGDLTAEEAATEEQRLQRGECVPVRRAAPHPSPHTIARAGGVGGYLGRLRSLPALVAWRQSEKAPIFAV